MPIDSLKRSIVLLRVPKLYRFFFQSQQNGADDERTE